MCHIIRYYFIFFTVLFVLKYCDFFNVLQHHNVLKYGFSFDVRHRGTPTVLKQLDPGTLKELYNRYRPEAHTLFKKVGHQRI
jgi:hypothetical protein